MCGFITQGKGLEWNSYKLKIHSFIIAQSDIQATSKAKKFLSNINNCSNCQLIQTFIIKLLTSVQFYVSVSLVRSSIHVSFDEESFSIWWIFKSFINILTFYKFDQLLPRTKIRHLIQLKNEETKKIVACEGTRVPNRIFFIFNDWIFGWRDYPDGGGFLSSDVLIILVAQ